MDTFNGSKPSLVNHSIIKDLELKANIPFNNETAVIGLSGFYDKYIGPNLLAIIVVVLFILYLTIKYIIKKDKDEQKEKKIKPKISKIDLLKFMEKQKEIQRQSVETTIQNHISDDYLINDEAVEEKEQEEEDQEDEDNLNHHDTKIMNNDPVLLNPLDIRNTDGAYNLDDAAKMIFSK